MLKLLDFFFLIFHSFLIVFNLTGWIHPVTRKINLVTLLLTGGSWFLLGLFYGMGYCPLTDWHFKILEKMGETDLPSSYITYIIMRWSGISCRESLIDILTLVGYLCALVVSVFVNIKYRKKKRTVYS
jgi:hypothetical protein